MPRLLDPSMKDDYGQSLRAALQRDLPGLVPGLDPGAISVEPTPSGDYLVIVHTPRWSFRELFALEEALELNGRQYEVRVRNCARRIGSEAEYD